MHPPLRVSILPGAKVVQDEENVTARTKRSNAQKEREREKGERKGERMERKLKAGAVGI